MILVVNHQDLNIIRPKQQPPNPQGNKSSNQNNSSSQPKRIEESNYYLYFKVPTKNTQEMYVNNKNCS